MSTIVTRSGKGSPLTHTEVDNNFTNLNTDKLQSGNTAASLTITSADINGGSIDGTAIGASSASTGAFTTLSASGVATVSAGSVSAPAITTTGDTNTGIFFPSADTIAFTEGGAESMRIDSSGNVGIGTSSPSDKLHVAGAGRFTSTAASLDTTGAFIDYASGVARIAGQASTGGTLAFYTNPNANFQAERMRITSDGNVGIGTTSPTFTSGSGLFVQRSGGTAAVEVFRSDASISGSISLQAGSIQNNLYSVGAKPLVLYTNSTEQARITSAGLFQFNSGYGSSAVAYGCRAWVNFNGTGTVAIRASGNVTSITDNGTGSYTVNFTTAMPDANYSVCGGASSSNCEAVIRMSTYATGSVKIDIVDSNVPAFTDDATISVAVFR
jgi:hypothetical protein